MNEQKRQSQAVAEIASFIKGKGKLYVLFIFPNAINNKTLHIS